MLGKQKRVTAELPPDKVHLPAEEPSTASAPSGQSDTQPLALPGYQHLPVGALLHQRRYEIRAVLSSTQRINVYAAEGDVEQRVCPNCGDPRNCREDQFCTTCGIELTGVEVTRPVYLVKESADSQVFQAERQIAELGLDHPNLVPIRDAFSETPYGQQARSYVVMDKVDMAPLTQLPVPQEEDKILNWGVQLAGVLEYLHQHHVAHQRVKVENVVVDDKHAKLTNFNVATVIPLAGRASLAPQRYAEDIYGLVQMLYTLLTGQMQIGAVSVPPAWAKILNRVVGPQDHRYSTAGELAADLQAMLDQRRRPDSIDLRIGRLSDVGRVRELNEDSLLTLELTQVRQSLSQPVGIYIVADGMGGHQGGEVASAMAIEVIAERVLEGLPAPGMRQGLSDQEELEALMKEAIRAANVRIYDQARSTASNMGTTVVMALMMGDKATIANVGDSRAYLLTDHSIEQISVDHSLVQRLIETQQITAEEARTHPERSKIYRVLGDKPKVEVDTFARTLKAGERLLLCSDGLNGMLEDDLIHQTVITSPDPQTACSALVEAANAAGGDDNVTVILLQMEAL
jgi:serine/threonine protein phosphatase PrpC